MAEALGHTIQFIEGRSRADLDNDPMLTFGHAPCAPDRRRGHDVSQHARQELPQIPWPVIIGIRHRLVHGYADIDHGILWITATEAAPILLAEVASALEAA